MRSSEGEYLYLGDGDGLSLEVHGPTVASCLARAVEGFVGAFADVHPSLIGHDHDVEVAGATNDALLLGVLEEALRLSRSGSLAIAVTAAEVRGRRARLRFEAVPVYLAHADSLPLVLEWQEVRLERDDGQWRGRVVCHPATFTPPR